MVNGLYTSGASMRHILNKQDLLSNALANVQTPGFKVSRLATHATVQSRPDVDGYMRQKETQRPDEIYTNFAQGSMVSTGNNLDVAMHGEGFLVLGTANGPRYLRGGNFMLDGDKNLVDLSGNKLLDEHGEPIRIPGSQATIQSDGTVSSDGEEVGKLAIVDFPKPYRLRQEGGNRFVPYQGPAGEEAAVPTAASPDTALAAGYIEASNANPVECMVQMIAQYRNYEADSRIIQAIDSTLDKAVNTVGRV